MAAGLFLQEREESDFPRDEHTEPLPLVVPRQDSAVHVKV